MLTVNRGILIKSLGKVLIVRLSNTSLQMDWSSLIVDALNWTYTVLRRFHHELIFFIARHHHAKLRRYLLHLELLKLR